MSWREEICSTGTCCESHAPYRSGLSRGGWSQGGSSKGRLLSGEALPGGLILGLGVLVGRGARQVAGSAQANVQRCVVAGTGHKKACLPRAAGAPGRPGRAAPQAHPGWWGRGGAV